MTIDNKDIDIFRPKLLNLIKASKKIKITSHLSPDDDAISSCLSLQYWLSHDFPNTSVDILITGSPVDRFAVFAGYNNIKFLDDISSQIEPGDTWIFLDGSNYSRFSNQPDLLLNPHISRICIDHHSSPMDEFDLVLRPANTASTTELIFQLASKNIQDNPEFCRLCLFGILGDTGNLNYIAPGQYHIFDIIKKILSASKIDIQDYKAQYNLISKKTFQLIGDFMKNTKFCHTDGWPDYLVSYIPRSSIKKQKLNDSLISESSDIYVAHYLRQIKGFGWGFVVRPHSDGSCRLSFRSLPDNVNVRDVVVNMNIGGGHMRASGAKILPSGHKSLSPQSAIKIVTDWMKQNAPPLT